MDIGQQVGHRARHLATLRWLLIFGAFFTFFIFLIDILLWQNTPISSTISLCVCGDRVSTLAEMILILVPSLHSLLPSEGLQDPHGLHQGEAEQLRAEVEVPEGRVAHRGRGARAGGQGLPVLGSVVARVAAGAGAGGRGEGYRHDVMCVA